MSDTHAHTTHTVTIPHEMWEWASAQGKASNIGPATFLRNILFAAAMKPPVAKEYPPPTILVDEIARYKQDATIPIERMQRCMIEAEELGWDYQGMRDPDMARDFVHDTATGKMSSGDMTN